MTPEEENEFLKKHVLMYIKNIYKHYTSLSRSPNAVIDNIKETAESMVKSARKLCDQKDERIKELEEELAKLKEAK